MSLKLRLFLLKVINFRFRYYRNVRAKCTIVSRIPLHNQHWYNYVPVQEGVWWNGGTPACILNLGIRRSCVFFKVCCKESMYSMFENKIVPLTSLNNSYNKS